LLIENGVGKWPSGKKMGVDCTTGVQFLASSAQNLCSKGHPEYPLRGAALCPKPEARFVFIITGN